jgi:hypothetical protein
MRRESLLLGRLLVILLLVLRRVGGFAWERLSLLLRLGWLLLLLRGRLGWRFSGKWLLRGAE